ncbi:hypothetical protein E8E14_008731 [Neopestalotiopsis sp. 37M]|nr:hypothetical protein E8E14_008731 [Neopestalotiopsis sp. 37M]
MSNLIGEVEDIDVVSRCATANPLVITTIAEMASKICLDWKIYKAKEYDGDNRNRCIIKNNGVFRFKCFEVEIEDENAVALVKELSTLDPKNKVLEPDLVQKIHEVLCQDAEEYDEDVDQDDRLRVGYQLNHLALEFFLLACHHNIKSDSDDEELIKIEVQKALEMAKIHEGAVLSLKARMLHKHAEIDDNDPRIDQDDFFKFANMAIATLHQTKPHYTDFEGSTAQQHEAVLGHPIIKGAMNKLARSIGQGHMKVFMKIINAHPAAAALIQQLPLDKEELEQRHKIEDLVRQRHLRDSEAAKRRKTKA